MPKTRILLADDHPMLRQGIRDLLERHPDFEVVCEANDAEEAIRLASELEPHVVIMDVGMPKGGGLEATRQIKAQHPEIAVMVLTVHDDEEYILGLLEAGAAGYLLKTAFGDELVQAVRSVSAGELVLHPTIGQKLFKRAARHQSKPIKMGPAEQLTAREAEVLSLAARGMSNQAISLELGVSLRTIKGHLVSIFAKMGVSSRTEAVLQALKRGWVSLDDVM